MNVTPFVYNLVIIKSDIARFPCNLALFIYCYVNFFSFRRCNFTG